MAIDKAVDSSVLDGYFTDIADAIRAKTGKSATMTPLEMPSEIASIETGGGGGGSLPSIISKVDGGSFTYATDTGIKGNKISHNLGVKPKGYIVWSDDVMMDGNAYANQTLMFSNGIGLPWVNKSSSNSFGYSYTMWRKTDGGVAEQNRGTGTLNDTEFAPEGFYYWRGGATYKWFVWA